MREKKILEVAKYIIKNKATIEQTANHFNLSISSIKKYINNKENLHSIDMELYNAVKNVQSELISIGNIVGGKNGVREPKYSDFEALEIAETMISNNLSISEASKCFNIPRSTLYEIVKRINNEELQEELTALFAENSEKFGQPSNRK